MGDGVPAFLSGEDPHGVVGTKRVAHDFHGGTTTSLVGKRVIGRWGGLLLPRHDAVAIVKTRKRLCDRDFMDRIFCQGDADGVADSIREEGADADGAFDPTVLAVAGFGDTEVDGVVPVRAFLIEPRDEQAVGLDHHFRIRCLHREHEIVIAVVTGDAGEFQRAFHHAERSVPVAVHDPIRERAMVRADPHGAAQVPAHPHQRSEFLADPVEFLGILRVAVFANFEFLFVGIVAGIHTDFFNPLRGFKSGVGFEMNVGDERHIAACGADLSGDVFEVRGVNLRLCGDAHDFASGICKRQNLGDAGGGVACVRGDHRLYAHRMTGTHADVTHHDLAGEASGVMQEVRAVSQSCGGCHLAIDKRETVSGQ